MKVKVKLNSSDQIIKDLGLDPQGEVQRHHTQNVLNHIQKYLPKRTGALIKETIAHTSISDNTITTPGPTGRYLYKGKVMVNAKTGKGPANIPGVGLRFPKGSKLKATSRSLEYTKSKSSPRSGPYWDERLVAEEGEKLVQELAEYSRRMGGSK